MAIFSYPMTVWGTIDTASNWVKSGSALVQGGGTDPFGSSGSLYMATTASCAISRSISVRGSGRLEFECFVSGGLSGSNTQINIFDSSSLTNVMQSSFFWNATGVVSQSIPNGFAASGSILTAYNVGSGWYWVRVVTNNVNASHLLYTSIVPANGQGAIWFHGQNAVKFGYPLYNTNLDDAPREGSTFVVAPSGERDSWIVGTYADTRLTFDLKYLRDYSNDQYEVASSYRGLNEVTGVNCSVRSWLNYGKTYQFFRWIPDSTNATAYVNSYLNTPTAQDAIVAMETDGTITIAGVIISNPDGWEYSR